MKWLSVPNNCVSVFICITLTDGSSTISFTKGAALFLGRNETNWWHHSVFLLWNVSQQMNSNGVCMLNSHLFTWFDCNHWLCAVATSVRSWSSCPMPFHSTSVFFTSIKRMPMLRLHLHFGQLTFNRTRACFPSTHFRNSLVAYKASHMSYIFVWCLAVDGLAQSISFNYRPEEKKNEKCLALRV